MPIWYWSDTDEAWCYSAYNDDDLEWAHYRLIRDLAKTNDLRRVGYTAAFPVYYIGDAPPTEPPTTSG